MNESNSKVCLVVDDDLDSIEIASKMAHSLGFEVKKAYNGKEALEICKAGFPDIILLDLNMPEMNGMQILENIRELERGYKPKAKLYIVVCSAEDAHYRSEKTVAAGADGYIMKPYYKDILRKKLEEIGVI